MIVEAPPKVPSTVVLTDDDAKYGIKHLAQTYTVGRYINDSTSACCLEVRDVDLAYGNFVNNEEGRHRDIWRRIEELAEKYFLNVRQMIYLLLRKLAEQPALAMAAGRS